MPSLILGIFKLRLMLELDPWITKLVILKHWPHILQSCIWDKKSLFLRSWQKGAENVFLCHKMKTQILKVHDSPIFVLLLLTKTPRVYDRLGHDRTMNTSIKNSARSCDCRHGKYFTLSIYTNSNTYRQLDLLQFFQVISNRLQFIFTTTLSESLNDIQGPCDAKHNGNT